VDYSLCIFCQTHQANVPLSQATDHGLAIVRNAADSRKKLRDTKNIDMIDRLENVFGSDMPKTLVWHRNCYGQFTYKNKIEHLQKPKPVHSKEEPSCSSNEASGSGRRSLQRAVQPVNWNLCIFCQSADQKARLISVMTKQLHNCSRLIPCWNQHYLLLG